MWVTLNKKGIPVSLAEQIITFLTVNLTLMTNIVLSTLPSPVKVNKCLSPMCMEEFALLSVIPRPTYIYSTMVKYRSTIPELRSRCSKRERYTKLRWQVKQARAANKNGRCTWAVILA